MSNQNLMISLAKVVISVAWADGDLTRAEVNSMKELLGRLPDLTARDWALLDMYIDSPVNEAERTRLIEELRQQISSAKDKALVSQTLKNLVAADGTITEDEAQVVDDIGAAIESVNTGALGGLMNLVKGRSKAAANAPNREAFFDEFVKNKVYYDVRRRLKLSEDEFNLPDDELRKLSLAGGLMARVAHIDPEVPDTEFEAIVEALQSGWNISPEKAALVAEVAVSNAAANLKRFHLTTQFLKLCTPDELTQFLDTLFAIATADGEASAQEIEEIRSMAKAFNLPNKYFINAKLKVPKEQRQQ